MTTPLGENASVPPSAMAQLVLPGTDAVPVLFQLMPLADSVACAEPLPDIATPLQVAAKLPDADVALMLTIFHVKSPHVPCGP